MTMAGAAFGGNNEPVGSHLMYNYDEVSARTYVTIAFAVLQQSFLKSRSFNPNRQEYEQSQMQRQHPVRVYVSYGCPGKNACQPDSYALIVDRTGRYFAMLDAHNDPTVQFLLDGKPWSKHGSYKREVGSGNVYESLSLPFTKEEMASLLSTTGDVRLRVTGGLTLTLVKSSVAEIRALLLP
jgi:hypothetical protein